MDPFTFWIFEGFNDKNEQLNINRMLESSNSTSGRIDESDRKHILNILFVGTGISFTCASAIIWTYFTTKAIRQRRVLSHLVVKCLGICSMGLGYWLNMVLQGINCYNSLFCSIQFAFLQFGNVCIMAAELAIANEIITIAITFGGRNLHVSRGTPIAVLMSYVLAFFFAILSISVGLTTHKKEGEGLTCYFGTFCWYRNFEMQLAFKYGILMAIILIGISAIVYLAYKVRVYRILGAKDLSSVGYQTTRTIVLLLFVHIISWGTATVWRIAYASKDPPKWVTSPQSGVLALALFNAAGAGYADIVVWFFFFPPVRRKYVDPLLLYLTKRTGIGEKALDDLRASDANFEVPEEDDVANLAPSDHFRQEDSL